MISIDGSKISMTRGDTLRLKVSLKDAEGQVYTPASGDRIVFTAKADYKDETPVIEKDFYTDTMTLELKPEDTKHLSMPKKYVYDIQLIYADGSVDTFVAKASLNITEEVG